MFLHSFAKLSVLFIVLNSSMGAAVDLMPQEGIIEMNKLSFSPMGTVGRIYASIAGNVVAKADLNGIDAVLLPVSGPLGTEVVWSNSLTTAIIRTKLDGTGNYDLKGHYISFTIPPAITEVNKVHFNPMSGVGKIYATLNGRVVAATELNGSDAALVSVTGPKGEIVVWSNSINAETMKTVLDGTGDYDLKGHYIVFTAKQSLPITEINKVHFEPMSYEGKIYASINGRVVAKAELNGSDAAQVSVTGPLGTVVVWSNSITSETIRTKLDGTGDYDGKGHYVKFAVEASPQ